MSVLRVALATKNPNKVSEIASILEGVAVTIVPPVASWMPPPEDDPTYEQNARAKAESLMALMKIPVLADDSGIEVDALEGEPGPRSARYAGPNATDDENLRALIEVVRQTSPGLRGARYRCIAVLLSPDAPAVVTDHTVEGTLLTKPRGKNGFGYDPIFRAAGNDRTMAELSPAEKDAISHRGHAFRALIPALRSLAR